MSTNGTRRSIVESLRESNWKALLLLGLSWQVAVAIGQVVDSLLIVVGVLLLGHLGAAALSGRSRWWLYGAAAVTGFVLVAWLAIELNTTAWGYPHSTLGWVPFRNGANLQWEGFYASLSVAVATGVALKPPMRYGQLTRAGMVAAVALTLFAIPNRWVPDPTFMVGGMTIILTVLMLVGVADTVLVWADRRGRSALAGAVAVPFVSLALLVVAAGVFWTFPEGPSMPSLRPPEPKDALVLGTVAVVVMGSLLVTTILVPKMLRPERPLESKVSDSE